MRVALVHDMLTQYGGAEKVLKVLSEMFPEAPIFTLIYDEEKLGHIFPNHRVKTSFLQKFPFAKEKYKWYLPLMPNATESYNLKGYDLVISSSSAFAKGVITDLKAKHVCYCHTPTRYLWIDSHDYIGDLKYPKFIKNIISLLLTRLRIWDAQSVSRVNIFIANSNNIQQKIKKYYHRGSEVVYPPVESNKIFKTGEKGDFFLAGGRLVPYKRFDLVVKAFNKLDIPIKIFGLGPDLEELKKQASDNIEFLGFVTEEEKRKLYSQARAFIHPQEEDFGITLVEAMSAGLPVIAFSGGGAQETLNSKIAGKFFYEQTWESLVDQIIDFKDENYDREDVIKEANRFSVEEFKNNILKIIDEVLKK